MNSAAISQAIAILLFFCSAATPGATRRTFPNLVLTVAQHAADGIGESTIRIFKSKYSP
jgi:hypothetical protein